MGEQLTDIPHLLGRRDHIFQDVRRSFEGYTRGSVYAK